MHDHCSAIQRREASKHKHMDFDIDSILKVEPSLTEEKNRELNSEQNSEQKIMHNNAFV